MNIRTAFLLLSYPVLFLIFSCKEPASTILSKQFNGYSGMAQINTESYLVVHDYKSYEEGTRFAIVKLVNGQNYSYQPLGLSNLPDGIAKPSDLESICSIPNTNNEFLAAESGYWEKTNGRIFHITIENNNANILKILNLPLIADNNKQQVGDNFEGLACTPLDANNILVLLGERGGSEKYPTGFIRWGKYSIYDQSITWSKQGLNGLPIKSPVILSNSHRDISDLFIDDENNIWSVATEDAGDNGPFKSVIYKVGTLDINRSTPVIINHDPKARWIIDGFKVEAMSISLKSIKESFLIIGTEDEHYGGIIRPLYK